MQRTTLLGVLVHITVMEKMQVLNRVLQLQVLPPLGSHTKYSEIILLEHDEQ